MRFLHEKRKYRPSLSRELDQSDLAFFNLLGTTKENKAPHNLTYPLSCHVGLCLTNCKFSKMKIEAAKTASASLSVCPRQGVQDSQLRQTQ